MLTNCLTDSLTHSIIQMLTPTSIVTHENFPYTNKGLNLDLSKISEKFIFPYGFQDEHTSIWWQLFCIAVGVHFQR